MPIFQIVPVANGEALEDFESNTRYENVPVKWYCRPICPENGLEVCPPCANDYPFHYMVAVGDIISLQFQLPDWFNADQTAPAYGWRETGQATFWLQLDLIGAAGTPLDTGMIDDLAIGWAVGYHEGRLFQNVNIAVNQDFIDKLDGDCFYFQLTICKPEYEEYKTICFKWDGPGTPPMAADPWQSTCPPDTGLIIGEDGQLYYISGNGSDQPYVWAVATDQPDDGDLVYNQGSGEWLQWNEVGGLWGVVAGPGIVDPCVNETCTTGAFKLATCEQTVKFEGRPGDDDFDCDNHYYGKGPDYKLGGGLWWFNNWMRLRGNIETVGFPTESTISDNEILIKSVYKERARIRLLGIPEIVAERLSEIMGMQYRTIDGGFWDNYDSVAKNNDESKHWYIDIHVERENCEYQPDCD